MLDEKDRKGISKEEEKKRNKEFVEMARAPGNILEHYGLAEDIVTYIFTVNLHLTDAPKEMIEHISKLLESRQPEMEDIKEGHIKECPYPCPLDQPFPYDLVEKIYSIVSKAQSDVMRILDETSARDVCPPGVEKYKLKAKEEISNLLKAGQPSVTMEEIMGCVDIWQIDHAGNIAELLKSKGINVVKK